VAHADYAERAIGQSVNCEGAEMRPDTDLHMVEAHTIDCG